MRDIITTHDRVVKGKMQTRKRLITKPLNSPFCLISPHPLRINNNYLFLVNEIYN